MFRINFQDINKNVQYYILNFVYTDVINILNASIDFIIIIFIL